MRKHFLTICFTIFLGLTEILCAQPIKLNNFEELKQREALPPPAEIKDPRIPDASDTAAIEDFIKMRLQDKNVIVDSVTQEELNGMSAMNVQHSAEYIEEMNQQNKSAFEKIYDAAIERVTAQDALEEQETIRNRARLTAQNQPQQQQWQQQKAPNFPVVNISLPPRGEKTLVPAQEHIPFLFADIDILATGQARITETVVVLANGKKLAHGLTRALPRYSTSRDGTRHEIDLNLDAVSINDTILPHKIITRGLYHQIVPEKEYTLAPGVYTYRFSYIVNRNLWEYNDFNEFYWNITGSTWNLVIARAGALITLPGANKPLGQVAFSGIPGQLRNDVSLTQNSINTLGLISTVPLFAGDGLHFIISLPKADFISPDWEQKLTWFLNDYGDILFSLFAAGAIIGAYALSWKRRNKTKKHKQSFKKTAATLRYLAQGVIDRRSFGSFMLELFRQKRLDIEESEDKIRLIKKSDNKKGLSRSEQKALRALFPEESVSLEIIKENGLRLRRSFSFLQKDINRRIKNLTLRLNGYYLILSILMLIIAELGIAALGNNFGQEAYILLSGSFSFALAIWFLRKKFKNRLINGLIKISSVISILLNIIILSLIIHGISAIIILITIYEIFAFTQRFAQRNGLLKDYVEDAQQYKTYIIEHQESLGFGQSFFNAQASIHAMETDKYFSPNETTKNVYALDKIKRFEQILEQEKII